MINDQIVYRCVICEQLVNEDDEGKEDVLNQYTDEPCFRCKKDIEENFIFVLISDKSDAERINRLHFTWVVPNEEVIAQYGSLEKFGSERIVFISETEALEVGLLEERLTDPETGILKTQLNETAKFFNKEGLSGTSS